MKTLKSSIAGAVSLAVVGGGLLLSAAAAHAATVVDPAITGDANASNGTVAFYDASGAQITSGPLAAPFAAYAVASSPTARTGTTKASLFVATPDHTKPNSLNWFNQGLTAASSWPVTNPPAPASVVAAAGPGVPVVSIASGDGNLAGAFSAAVNDPTTGYNNIMQIRLEDSGPGQAAKPPFWATDVLINSSAGTWTQVFPTVKTATSTTLTASPDPSAVGDTVTLTATESPAVPGSIQFADGGTALGAPVAVDGTGKATTTSSSLAQGSHSLTAVFTPTDTTTYAGSTGSFTATVNPAAPPTTTALAIGGTPATSGSDVTLTATVSPSAAPGTVSFFDNGSSTPIAGTVTSPSAGTYVLDLPTGFSVGSHSIVAKFASANVANFKSSQSAAQSFITQAPLTGACAQPGSVCNDTQYIQATVPVGTLVINTPYTDAQHALDLGTLQLDATATQLQGHATFSNIKVTDTRSGNLPWTVTALASNLTDGGTHSNSVINNQNLGLTSITATPGNGFTGTITPTDNAAAAGVAPGAPGSAGLGGTTAHTIAAANHGLGTVTMQGTLTLNAPSSTEPGLFTGTITFTVG